MGKLQEYSDGELRELLKTGRSKTAIAKEIGVTYQALQKRLIDSGIVKKQTRKKKETSELEELKDLKTKINAIYDIALSMYAVDKFYKDISKARATGLLQARFILKKELKEITDILGVELGELNSEVKGDIEIQADNILEYIIMTHEPIYQEIIGYKRNEGHKEVEDTINNKNNLINNDFKDIYQTSKEEVKQSNKDSGFQISDEILTFIGI